TLQPSMNFPSGGNFPESIAVGDFNGDGKLDVAVAHFYSNDVTLLLGNGDGTFQPAQVVQTFASDMYLIPVAVGDVNGDGKLDLVVANAGSNNVSVLLGNGDGTFQAAKTFPVGNRLEFVALGDFNGDRKLDLAVASYNTNTVGVLFGVGDGTFLAL